MTHPIRLPLVLSLFLIALFACSGYATPRPPLAPIEGIQLAHGHLQQHHIGAARWVLEKATRQAPRSMMLRQCLTQVTQAIPSPPSRTPLRDRLLTLLTRLTLIEWGTLTSLGVAMMGIQWVRYRWRRRVPSLITLGLLGVWMGGCAMGWGAYAWEWRYPWAVLADDQVVSVTPNGPPQGVTVVAGEKVRQRGQRPHWVHIERANGQHGWVPSSTCWTL